MDPDDQGTLKGLKILPWILHQAHTDTPVHSETIHVFHKGNALNTVKITGETNETQHAELKLWILSLAKA